MKSQLRKFLYPCLHRLKISKIWRRTPLVAIPQSMEPAGYPKNYRPISLACVKSSRGLSTSVSNQLLNHCSLKSRLGFERKVNRGSSDSIDRKHREFIVYDSVWHMTLSGTVALHVGCLRLLPDKQMVSTQNDHRASRKPTFYRYYQWQQAKPDSPFKKRRLLKIGLGSLPFQHLKIYVYICS